VPKFLLSVTDCFAVVTHMGQLKHHNAVSFSGDGLDLLAYAARSFSKESPEQWASPDAALTTQSGPFASIGDLVVPASPQDCRWQSVSTMQMYGILLKYGPELPSRNWDGKDLKKRPHPTSLRRMFKNTNPAFFEHFTRKDFNWVPLIGKDQEIKRRVEMRKSFERTKQLLKKRKVEMRKSFERKKRLSKKGKSNSKQAATFGPEVNTHLL
jgi:hypothetical protein